MGHMGNMPHNMYYKFKALFHQLFKQSFEHLLGFISCGFIAHRPERSGGNCKMCGIASKIYSICCEEIRIFCVTRITAPCS